MTNEINPINVNQPLQDQTTKEKKDKDKEQVNYFAQQDKAKAEGKPTSPAEVIAALNKEVPDKDTKETKTDKKHDKGKKPPAGSSQEDPDETTAPLLRAALSGDTTALAQLNALLGDRNPSMVLSAQKAINNYNLSKPQNT